METEKTTEGAVNTTNNEGEGNQEGNETITISKTDYEKLNQTLGSLKRENKDLKKPKEEVKETPQSNQSDTSLLEKAFLRSAQITQPDEVKLALETAKKWGVAVDTLVDDEDFKVKLEKLRTQKSNELATSGIKGSPGTSQAKNTPEYWIAKGTPPSTTDVPDRKTRAKIARAMMASTKNSKTFYNE